jgi:exopolysaccharide production protein ExoQ
MNILLNPIILSLSLAVITVATLIFVLVITKGRLKLKINLLNVERGFAFTFFTLILVGDAQSYIGNFSLQYLGSYSENQNVLLYTTVQLVAYGLMIFLARSRINYLIKALLFLMRDPFLYGLILLTFISSFWSQTPLETFKAGLVLTGLTIYSSVIAVRCNFQELSKYFRQFGAWITGTSVAVHLLLPSLLKNDKGSWQGIVGHPNVLGYVMALTAILWVINALDRPKTQRWSSLVIAGISIIVMLLANCSGAILTFLVIAFLLAIFRILSQIDLRMVWPSIPLLLLIGIPSGLLMIRYRRIIFALIGKDENLTGRGEFWPAIINAIEQRLAFGYGYDGFWQSWRGVENPAAQIRTINFVPTHSHNGFLDLALALGLVGVALFALSFIRNVICTLVLMNSGKRTAAEISTILLTYVIYANISEPGLWEVGQHVTIYTILSVRLGLEVRDLNFSENIHKLSY